MPLMPTWHEVGKESGMGQNDPYQKKKSRGNSPFTVWTNCPTGHLHTYSATLATNPKIFKEGGCAPCGGVHGKPRNPKNEGSERPPYGGGLCPIL